jgi:hypothetical protein
MPLRLTNLELPIEEPEEILGELIARRLHAVTIVSDVVRKMGADPVELAKSARELLAKIPQAYGGAQPGHEVDRSGP